MGALSQKVWEVGLMWHVYAFRDDWLMSTVVPQSEIADLVKRYRMRYRLFFKRRLS